MKLLSTYDMLPFVVFCQHSWNLSGQHLLVLQVIDQNRVNCPSCTRLPVYLPVHWELQGQSRSSSALRIVSSICDGLSLHSFSWIFRRPLENSLNNFYTSFFPYIRTIHFFKLAVNFSQSNLILHAKPW